MSNTIIALATPPGVGAIGVIRLSGPKAILWVDEVFYGKNLNRVDGNTVHYGKIKDESGHILDECLATVYRGPKSYTKEDVVEISCHGSSYILEQVIQLLLRKGCRMAERGEFTMRAFVNGQMDLSQAEAVADLIASDNSASHELAMKQMRGGFSDQIAELRQELIDFAALIELELDFGEEDLEFADRGKLEDLVVEIIKVIKKLIDSFYLGNVLKNGVATVIAGRPNAGKSTLLNALINEERAIVSDIAGTTRDTIEERLNIKGIDFRFVDTAGIRKATDQIESVGVGKALSEIQKSTLVLHVVDITDTTPEMVWSDIAQFGIDHSRLILLLNKMDLNPYAKPEDYYKEGLISEKNLLTTSALNKMNIEGLKDLLYQTVVDQPGMLDQTIVSNSRHYDALHKALESLDRVLNGLKSRITGDFIAMDIRQALYHLGEITGEIHTDDLLDSIFGRFCIGK